VIAATALACACDAEPVAAPSDERASLAAVEPRPTDEPSPRPTAPARPSPAQAGVGPLASGTRAPAIATVDDDAPSCAICAFDGGPKLVVLGALADPGLDEPLRDLDAIASFYADDGLGAFIVLGEQDGELVRAPVDPSAHRVDAEQLHARLRLALPVRVPARDPAGFDSYRVAQSPTVLLLDRSGTVLWSGIAMPRWRELDAAIRQALDQ